MCSLKINTFSIYNFVICDNLIIKYINLHFACEIGIMAQELYENENYDHPNLSYIAASYVKFIEGGGGRVVPIL